MSGIVPEGPAVPPVTERAMWVVMPSAPDLAINHEGPVISLDEVEALGLARRWHGAVARLPLVADYRDAMPAETYRSKVVWRSGSREAHPLTDPIPPGGPVVIEHQDTEDDGSVTIWFRRVDAG